jgi:hypothetical protein
MQKKRKKFLVALLMVVHALLLFHEVTVNRVLCYKPDGSVELEMAMFDYECLCKDSQCCDEGHHHNPAPPPQTQTICEGPDGCYDQPFNGSWLERNINPTKEETQLFKLFDINIEVNLYSDDAFGCFFESLPLRKFLNGIPPEYSNIALRC